MAVFYVLVYSTAMDIHPILVHFPVALFTFFAILEIITIKKLKESVSFFYAKALILLAGILGAFMALSTGEGAEHRIPWDATTRNVIETHAFFATLTTWVFVIIGFSYLILVIERSTLRNHTIVIKYENIYKKLLAIATWLQKYLVKILAVIGLVSITITGGLGGSIVYGKDVDPIVSFIYRLIIGQ